MLYLVTVSHDLVVEADSLLAAEQVALESWRKEEAEPFVASPVSLHRIADAPPIWRDSYPWGGGGDRTVREILAQEQRGERGA